MIDNKVCSDHEMLSSIGHSFTISDKLLGRGSFGDVYVATDERGRKVAVKCCDIDEYGVPSILESSIMASIIHPFLNRALRILASDTKLYIIQDLAITDLAQYTRRNKGNHKPNLEELRKWCFSIANAVSALHMEQIIHADIKASNVLLYEDGTVKLSDYTLATKKWDPESKFTHNACTCTHRPLEGLTRRPWNEALDIWSLGCTFYEIAYGELLFPYQGELESNQKVKNKEIKIRIRNRSINALLDWAARGPIPCNTITIKPYTIDYIPYSLCPEFNHPEMNVFNDLLCHMLVVDPDQRPNIKTVLQHPFFDNLKCPLYLSVTRNLNRISISEQARVTRYIQRYSTNTYVQTLAFNIYCRCNELDKITEHIRAAAATWIASKIVLGYPPSMSISPHQLLSAEREICHNLLFRLHCL